MKQLRIRASCRITAGIIKLNGNSVLDEQSDGFAEFIRLAYKNAGMSYPKFYKMDDLCKLALVATEYVLEGKNLSEQHANEKIALVIQNASSTYDTDAAHQQSIDERENYFPSPAIFVYTLPNIMLGEICIRHKFLGENALLLTPSFDPERLQEYVTMLTATGKASSCICGWVEKHGHDYDAFLMLTEVGDEGEYDSRELFTTNNIEYFYTL